METLKKQSQQSWMRHDFSHCDRAYLTWPRHFELVTSNFILSHPTCSIGVHTALNPFACWWNATTCWWRLINRQERN